MSSGNGLKSFAFTGLGNIGKPIVTEFVKDKSISVTILTRDTSKPELQEFAKQGAKLVKADYSSEESLAKALEGVDAVISVIGNSPEADAAQLALAKASKQAGVKLFVPSEFGLDYYNPASAPLHPGVQLKVNFQQQLKDLGLSVFSFNQGLFADWTLVGLLGYDAANAKATVRGGGDGRYSSTALVDIATFVHQAVTTLPVPAAGESRVLYFEGFSTTQNEVIAAAEKVQGKKWELSQEGLEGYHSKQQQPDYEGFGAWLISSLADGRGKIEDGKLSHKELPGWKPTVDSVEKAVRLALGGQ